MAHMEDKARVMVPRKDPTTCSDQAVYMSLIPETGEPLWMSVHSCHKKTEATERWRVGKEIAEVASNLKARLCGPFEGSRLKIGQLACMCLLQRFSSNRLARIHNNIANNGEF